MNKKKSQRRFPDWAYRLVSGGNLKLARRIATWSTASGNDKRQTKYGVVKGTCGKGCKACIDDCYARHAEVQYPSVLNSRAARTLVLRQDRLELGRALVKQLSSKRRSFDIVRLNQSGELESEDQLLFWVELARKFKDVRWYIYTKQYQIAINVIRSGLVPANFQILFSIWGQYGVQEYNSVKDHPSVKAFVVENDEFDCTNTCPSYFKNGKRNPDIKCGENCFLCISGHSKPKAIRCPKH